LKNITGALAFELTPFLSVGFSITGKMGSYEYMREYKESDVNSLYQTYSEEVVDGKLKFNDIDFKSLSVDEMIEQDISGITGALGIQGKVGKFMRIGLSLKFPTYFDISEDFTQGATAEFDNGDVRDTTYYFTNSYSIASPWVLSGGMSFHFLGLTLATGFEYTDLSQMEFDENNDLNYLNLLIKKDMAGVMKLGAGLEWEMPWLPVALRGSFNYMTPPYLESFDGEESITIAIGAGIYLAPNIRMDLLGSLSQYKKMWNLYGSSEDTQMFFRKNPYDFGLQLTYRY